MTGRDEVGHAGRVEALRRYHVLDTPPETEFDDLAAIAAQVAGFPIAAITFVDDRREWVKASFGLELGEVDVERSLGAHAVAAPGEPTTLKDAKDSPLSGCAWVTARPWARGYAALPLTTPGGLTIGTLCVLDPQPHPLTDAAREGLERVRRLVLAKLEHRREASLGTALVSVLGFDGRFARMNAASESLLGYTPEEMIGRRALEFIHPDDVQRTTERLESSIEGDPSRGFENRYRTKDGRWRWLLWRGHPVWEERLFYAVAQDITARKEAELALRESEERYRLLAENATDMISSHTLDGTFLYASGACRTLLGYEPDELIGTSGFELYHPSDLPGVYERYEHLLDTGGRERDTVRFRRKDGSWVWVDVIARIVEDEHGQPILQAATRDMTEARRALEALQAAEERFRRAFDDAPIGMAIFDLDRRMQRVNAALCELVGYSREEMLGRTGDAFSDPLDVAETNHQINLLLEGALHTVSLEKRYVHKDGHTVWAQSNVSVMRDAEGKPVGLLGQVQDIGSRRRAEEETRRARVAAERANRAKSDFLSRMSHELRTPLNAVLGFAQLLELDDLTPSQRESVARILAGGNHLLGLINDVLDISRIEAGQLPMSPAPVELARTVQEVVELLAPVAAERSADVRTSLDGAEGVAVLADRRRLEQILLNLVTNAIKYGPEGGIVEVTAERRSRVARVTVVDQGPGVAPADLDKLFTPFERLAAAGTATEGTGLGLALSRNLAMAMGGSIGYARTGSGSEFWLEVPLARDARGEDGRRRFSNGRRAALSDPSSRLCPSGSCSLLYIEDNAADVRLIERLLAGEPCEVVHAATGAAGIELARSMSPGAILLDLDLPDMHGLEVFAELRVHEETAAIPVVVVSASAQAGDAQRLLVQGAVAYEPKPIDVERLFRALGAALGTTSVG